MVLRQSLMNTMYSYAGAVIGFINIIWLFPYVLEAEQFGLTRVMISISMIGAQVASLGMGNVTLRFFPRFRNREKRHFGFLFIAVVIPLAGFLLLSIAGWLFREPVVSFYTDESVLFGEYYKLLFPLLLFILYFHILECYIRSLFDTVAATFLQDILLRLLHTSLILVYYFDLIPFHTFMWLFVLAYAVQTLLLLAHIGIKRHLFIIPDFSGFTGDRVRSMADYALFATIGSVATIAFSNIDMIMLGGLTTLGETAIYAVSFYLASMIKIPSKGLIKISQPIIAEANNKNDLDTVSSIYSKSSINQLLVGGIIFILVWINLDHIYRFLPEEYHAGAYVFLFVGLAKLFEMTAGFNATIIRTSRWYRFDLYATLLLLALMIITNLIFIPIFGIVGAAMATALSILLQNSAAFFYIKYRFGIQPFSKATPVALLVLAAILAVSAAIPEVPVWILDLLIRSSVAAGLFVLAVVSLNISDDLRQFIRDTLRLFTGKR